MEVLECLQKYGQRLDVEIAKETELPWPGCTGTLPAW